MAYNYNPNLLAPNGKPTNLCEDDYKLVRSPEFLQRFGDWMNEQGRCILDENGEPQAFWHGTNREFDAFDFSRLAENTGGGTWQIRGEEIPDDSEKAMFFTSSYPAAVSYAFLAEFHRYQKEEWACEKILPFIRKDKVAFGAAKTREEFLRAVETLQKSMPVLAELSAVIRAFPDKKIISELLPKVFPDEESRTGIANMLVLERRSAQDIMRFMHNGGISNVFHNYAVTMACLLTLKDETGRLAANDLSLPNPCGTFEDYNFYMDEGAIWSEGGRLCVKVLDGKTEFFDTMDPDRIRKTLDTLINAAYEKLETTYDAGGWEGYADGARIYRCFLETARPFEHDYEHSSFPDRYKDTAYSTGLIAARQVRKALSDGYDSVVYRNIRDPFSQDSVGVFSPGQILIADMEKGVRIPRHTSAAELAPWEKEAAARYGKSPVAKTKSQSAGKAL